MRRCELHGWWLVIVVGLGVACTAGCQSGDRVDVVRLTPQEQLALRNRALNLLLRAAESDLDVTACNAIEALVDVAPQDGLPVFREAIYSPSPLKRYAGFVALGAVRDCAMADAMTAGTNDRNQQVRLAAAFAAYRCGKTGFARLLLHTVTDATEESLRANAADLLGRLREPRSEKYLLAALRTPANRKSDRVTLHLYWALARIGNAEALQALLLAANSDAATRTDALLFLARLGDPAATDVMRYILASETEEYLATRLIAARGLGKLGLKDGFVGALRLLDYEDRRDDPNTPDDTFAIRSMAIHALGEIGDPRALGPLREVAADQSDPRLQVAASYAICKILE